MKYGDKKYNFLLNIARKNIVGMRRRKDFEIDPEKEKTLTTEVFMWELSKVLELAFDAGYRCCHKKLMAEKEKNAQYID